MEAAPWIAGFLAAVAMAWFLLRPSQFADPEVGQVWRSQHSGSLIRVEDVSIDDSGRGWHLSVQHRRPDRPAWNPIAMSGFYTRRHWCAMLREEARVLVGCNQPSFFPAGGPPPIEEQMFRKW